MGYFKRDSFRFFNSIDYGEFIIYDIDNPKEFSEYIEKHSINNVWITIPNIKYENINFNNSITSLMISGVDFEKIPVFNNVRNLIGMSSNIIGNVNAEKFPMLEYLSIDYKNCKHGLSDFESLKSLKLWNFVKNKNGFLDFKLNANIRILNVITSDIVNLEGLEQYDLESIRLSRCKKLVDINSLISQKETLIDLCFEKCKKVNDLIEIISQLKELKRLSINDFGEIQSLSFITQLRYLEEFIFVGTIVRDGDLTPCSRLNYVGFQDKKHYNMKFKELNPTYNKEGNG